MNRYLTTAIVAALVSGAAAEAQVADLAKPLEIPLYLSGNFGELRSNHFHSGLDFKTQGRTGIPVHSAEAGYVSRVVVSPWGFGRAVYVTHPALGLTTVYGHLEAFSDKIDKPVRDEQYNRETFTIDMSFMPGEITVSRGEVIGRSGNAGSSGGPHLHMDVRDAVTEDALDPMPYFRHHLADKAAADVRAIALYAVAGEGMVQGAKGAVSQMVHSPAQFAQPFTAWGRVVPAIKAYDRMTGTQNIYGVKYLTLIVDDETVYKRTIDRFSFDNTRAVNTLVDYAGVVNNGSWMMTTAVPPTHPLGAMIEARDNGVVDIDEERDYKCRWILEDDHGNRSTILFTIKGKRADIAPVKRRGDTFGYKGHNSYTGNGVKVKFDDMTFYDDIDFVASSSERPGYVSLAHTIGSPIIPIARPYELVIDITADTLVDKKKYVLLRLNGKRRSAVDAEYRDGTMVGTPSALGTFAVATDTKAPAIKPELPASWGKKGVVSYRISDNLSGVMNWRGEIDGRWALFELDGKTGRLSFKMDTSRFERGKKHTVRLTVTDRCGNSSTDTSSFTW